jgi:U3 small nucleolar RNA-associated protein 21
VFAAWGGGSESGVWVFRRGKKVAMLEPPPGHDEPIQQLLIFGPWIVGCCTTRIEVWKSESYEHYTTIFASKAGDLIQSTFTGHICHMPTLLNKVLVGKQDGSVEIWNLSTR